MAISCYSFAQPKNNTARFMVLKVSYTYLDKYKEVYFSTDWMDTTIVATFDFENRTLSLFGEDKIMQTYRLIGRENYEDEFFNFIRWSTCIDPDKEKCTIKLLYSKDSNNKKKCNLIIQYENIVSNYIMILDN